MMLNLKKTLFLGLILASASSICSADIDDSFGSAVDFAAEKAAHAQAVATELDAFLANINPERQNSETLAALRAEIEATQNSANTAVKYADAARTLASDAKAAVAPKALVTVVINSLINLSQSHVAQVLSTREALLSSNANAGLNETPASKVPETTQTAESPHLNQATDAVKQSSTVTATQNKFSN